MKYRIKFKPIIILVLICVLLLFRLSFVVTGDIDSSPEDLACAQENIGNLIDYIPVLLTFAITATLSLKNSRQNKASCIINVFAALCCFVAIVFQDGIAMWNAFGSYFSLAFMLLSFCVVPIHEDEMLKTDNAKDERSQSVRVILIALIIIMIALAVFSFFNGTPKYTVSNGIVYLFGLVILLLISDSIETFSIGSLFTLKKKVQEQAAEVSKLSQQNQELRTQMISVVSTSLSKYSLQGTTQGRYLTGGVPPVRFSM